MRKYDTVLLDLDGTLLDPKKRLYVLFKELTGCTLSYEEYWQEKAQGRKQREMLELVGTSVGVESFRQKWLDNVERDDLLRLDTLFPEIREVLTGLQLSNLKLYLVTNRQSLEGTRQQLERLDIAHFFADIIVTCQRYTKAEAVRRVGVNCSHAIFAGDSIEDMEAAEMLGIPGVLLSRGNAVSAKDTAYRINNLKELEGIVSEE